VAAGLVGAAVASDGGGSIRIPAAFCGLFGIKPGPGIVPVAGGHGEHWFGMSQWGPLSTTVADGALLLDVLAGTNRYRDVAPASRPLRLALSTRPPALGVRTDAEVRAAAEACADVLREAGHTVTLTDPPYSQRLTAAFLHRFLGGVAHEVDQLGLDVQRLEPGHRGMVRAGRYINRTRPVPPDGADEWRNRFTAWFADYDLLLTPTTARTAVRADGWVAKSWLLKVQDGSQNVPFTQAWNVASFPAASVPAGLSRAGMPIGLQVIAPRGGEALVLSLALQLERLRPWPRHAPLARVPAPTLAEVAGG
jgi:amidase